MSTRRVHAPTLIAAIAASTVVASPFAVFAWIVLDRITS